MFPSPQTDSKLAGQQLTLMFLSLMLLNAKLTLSTASKLDTTGKSVTFYPSSLMISHTAHPLVFYSDTKLMHLVTRLKVIPPGPPFQIDNNCSIPQEQFFNTLLGSIHGTQRITNRLLSLSSFCSLLECNSYLRRFFTCATGLPSTMTCPRH